MSAARDVRITLTDAQIAWVVYEAAGDDSLTALFTELNDPQQLQQLQSAVLLSVDGNTHSQSLIRGLLILCAFPMDGQERELTDVARELAISPSTTHRYAKTLMAIGLLEQDPSSRKYRRARLCIDAMRRICLE